MPSNAGLVGRPRRRLTALVRARESHCHLCGYPIDLSLDRLRHPLASCIDELRPRHHGGNPLDPTNCRHAHRVCNGSRGTQPITPEVQARCRTLVEAELAQEAPPTLATW